jgi:PAS domain S-box-containing protein
VSEEKGDGVSDLQQAGGSQTNSAELKPPAQSARASVLLVDDQPARLLTYEAILEGLGVRCVRALSGAAALTALLHEQFAVILLDVEMPEMDGFEVARLIRAHPRYEQTPIIFVTGVRVSELDQLKGYQAGAIDYLAVPVVPEILRSKVAVLIELHQRRRELSLLNEALTKAREQLTAQHARALAGTEAHLARLFEHPTDTTVVLHAERDSSSTIIDWVYENANANALHVLGHTRESLLGASLGQVIPQRASKIAALASQVLESGKSVRIEDGIGERYYLITIFAFDEESVVVSAADVTDRKLAEVALHENERRIRALLENAPMAVAHNAPEGRFQYVNKGFCELLGYSAEELLAMTWQQVTHPEDIESDQALAQKVIAGEMPYYSMQKRYVRKDGRAIWVTFFGNFVRDEAGQVLQGLAVAIDITAQRSAEEKLRTSEQRFRELANNIDQLAWTCNELGFAEWYNDRWYDYTGETFEEMRGTGWMKVQHPAHLERVSAGLRRCMSSGQPWEDSFPLLGKDGEYRWFLSRATPIRDATGKIIRWFGTNTDVTELRRLEEALKESAQRKDEFLAMLSHELRNPIAPIRNAAEVLSRLPSQDARQLEMARIVQRQTQHLSRLLDDLLEVARITHGRIELRHEILPLSECIKLALEIAQPLILEKGHELSVQQESRPVYLNVDRARFVLCLANVLSNAAKYTPTGGRISLHSRADGSLATIEVSDNGMGISAALLPRVFDPFVQAHQSLDRSQGGLGVGLAVCKRLIEMHGGTIRARSGGEGGGATFVIALPLTDKPTRPSPDSSAAPAKALRILIVDDNHDAADSLALMLQTEGHTIRAVYSAEAAIEDVCDFSPDVVLLDIGLPRMDGYAAARRMRQLVPSARLIALTGYGQPEDKSRARDAGFEDHLLKPVEPSTLGRVLGEVIEQD